MQAVHEVHSTTQSQAQSVECRADSIRTESTSAASIAPIHGPACSLERPSDDELLAQTRRLVGHSNRVLAALLAHLAEVEARGVHRIRACSSLYTYCIYELRLSEDEAARRVSAARLVKRFPALFVAVERGELHLTGLLLLGPHLTVENHGEVLSRAKHRTKKEIQNLVRELSPWPDVPARIEPLGPVATGTCGVSPSWEAWVQSLCPVRELGPGDRPAAWLEEPRIDAVASRDGERAADDAAAPAPARVETARSDPAAPARVDLSRSEVAALGRVDPRRSEVAAPGAPVRSGLRSATTIRAPSSSVTGPQRYRVQFSAGEEYVELVERAQALLSHADPNDSLESLHVRAMRALVVELEKRRYAVTEQPRNAPAERGAERERSRAVPAEVRRAVFERDGGRCTYVDDRGQRCRETRRIELHHVEPFAHGGVHHVANVRLCCRAHNTLAAEEEFGRSLILKRKDAARHESAPLETRLGRTRPAARQVTRRHVEATERWDAARRDELCSTQPAMDSGRGVLASPPLS